MHIETPLAHQIPEACRRIGVARTSIYELIKAGEIKSIKIGSRTLIPESELQRFITKRLEAVAA
jgi:excisionase family DNA binding protein